MDVIVQPNRSIINELPQQIKLKDKKYRLSKLLVFAEIENGNKLIYNELTRTLIRIKPEEFNNIYSNESLDYLHFLYRNYFLVLEDFNEIEIVEKLRSKFRKIKTDSWLDSTNSFTILTTTKCNARCFYCYELKSKGKHNMTTETAEKVVDYIISVADKRKQIKLSWFGGEPLANYEVIDIVTSKLRNEGFNFMSTIISNGYLFTEEMSKKAANSWNLKSAQITLDGTEEVYNKTKNYVYKDTNPFQIVLQNIQNLIDNKIKVSVRMNCDTYNIEDLSNLLDLLYERFKPYCNKLFTAYIHEIFEQDGYYRTDEQKENLYKGMKELYNKLIKYNLTTPNLSSTIRSNYCMCDSGTGVMISVDGDIGLCEHFIDSDFFSHIDTKDIINQNILDSWQEYRQPQEMCLECPLYPNCLKLQKCEDSYDCSIPEKEYILYKERKAMLATYKKYLQNKNKNVQKCTCSMNLQPTKPLTFWDKLKMKFLKK